jgi:hypothetical protein
MVLVITRMRALEEKGKEFSQTIASLIGFIRTEKECQPSNQIEFRPA